MLPFMTKRRKGESNYAPRKGYPKLTCCDCFPYPVAIGRAALNLRTGMRISREVPLHHAQDGIWKLKRI